jgi:hypothetical protein
MDIFFQIINTYNKKNIFTYFYKFGSIRNGKDDDGDWVEKEHDANGNGQPDVGEINVDEEDEGRIQEDPLSLFPIIPSVGFTIYF